LIAMPAAPLSPRQALAAAISAHAAAVAHVERVRAAKIKAWQIGGADSVEAARLVLANAKRTETTLVLSGLLNEAPPTGPSVAAAEQELAAALTTQAAVEDARTQLLHEEELARRRLDAAEAERALAIGACVRADPLFAEVMNAFEASQRKTEILRELINLMPGKSPQESMAAQVWRREVSGAAFGRIKATIGRLTVDPAAGLPSLDDLLSGDIEPAAAGSCCRPLPGGRIRSCPEPAQ
jgi:hypothetical protein